MYYSAYQNLLKGAEITMIIKPCVTAYHTPYLFVWDGQPGTVPEVSVYLHMDGWKSIIDCEEELISDEVKEILLRTFGFMKETLSEEANAA